MNGGPAAGGDDLVVRDLSTIYATSRGQIVAVRDVSVTVAPGEAIGIVGESGCGKTALALALVGLLPRNGRIAAGEVMLGDIDLASAGSKVLRNIRGRRIAIVFQDSMTSLDPVMPIGRQITEGLIEHLGLSRKQARVRAAELLTEVGVPEAGRRLRQVSAPAERRAAPEGRHRGRDRRQSRCADRRRAHHGARRHHPGAAA